MREEQYIMTQPTHPFRMTLRILKLLLGGSKSNCDLVTRSYDRVSAGYDNVWTHHMRDLTDDLLSRIDIQNDSRVLDLTCGTGYATVQLAGRTQGSVIGVDASEGMLTAARDKAPDHCEFIQADILDYLKQAPSESFNIVTSCWGLGYSKPFKVLRQIRRVLRTGGRAAIIDNSLFSLAEILQCSFATFSAWPDRLQNLMRFHFLTGPMHLRFYFRLAGLSPQQSWKGIRSYTVATGREAIDRLRSTGAAAGFEYAGPPEYEQEIFDRFAAVIEHKYRKQSGIPITHRYLAGIAQK